MRNFILGALIAFLVMLATDTSPQQVLTKVDAWVKVMWAQRPT
jgi:hypothetical protein